MGEAGAGAGGRRELCGHTHTWEVLVLRERTHSPVHELRGHLVPMFDS